MHIIALAAASFTKVSAREYAVDIPPMEESNIKIRSRIQVFRVDYS